MLLVEVLLPGGGGGGATQFWPPADAPEHEVPNSPQFAPFTPPWAPALHCAELVVVMEHECGSGVAPLQNDSEMQSFASSLRLEVLTMRQGAVGETSHGKCTSSSA